MDDEKVMKRVKRERRSPSREVMQNVAPDATEKSLLDKNSCEKEDRAAGPVSAAPASYDRVSEDSIYKIAAMKGPRN